MADEPKKDPIEELVEALTAFVKRKSSSKEKSRLPDWLNSPFVVTVLGGLTISLLTLHYQNRQSEIEQKRQQFEQEYNDRKQVLFTFINAYPASGRRLYDYLDCYAWLEVKTNTFDRSLGLNREQMRQRLSKLDKIRLNSVGAESFPREITVTFTNGAVLSLASNFESQLSELFDETNGNKIDLEYNELNPTYERLIERMGDEIKALRNKHL